MAGRSTSPYSRLPNKSITTGGCMSLEALPLYSVQLHVPGVGGNHTCLTCFQPRVHWRIRYFINPAPEDSTNREVSSTNPCFVSAPSYWSENIPGFRGGVICHTVPNNNHRTGLCPPEGLSQMQLSGSSFACNQTKTPAQRHTSQPGQLVTELQPDTLRQIM